MKKDHLSGIIAIILSLCGGLHLAWGQSPPGLMNFQGRLTDSSNNPLSGPHDFIFEVYDAPAGGTQLWTETQSGITVANGVLAAQLGAASAIPAAIFSAPSAYLQITVDGVALSPRQRLATAPYAFNSGALQGREYGAFVSTDSAVQSIGGDKTFTGTLASAQLRLSGGVSVSSESLASLGAGIRISSNVYIVGFSSAAKYYGDGSALTGINASGAITSAGQITDGIITLAKLAQSGCANNEIPKWNGAAWTCAADAGGSTYTADEASLHLAGGVFSALPSSVTLQGNAFNSAGQLVRLDGSGELPAGVKAQAIKTGAYLNDVRVSSSIYSDSAANAGAVANGVYTTGSYADPTWITSLDGAKITGNISGNAATVSNGVYTTGSYTDPVWITNLSTGKIDLSTVTTALAGKLDAGAQAASVADGVYTTGSYADPAWITSLATAKISL
ncbi:MAG: hypothetical protein HY550_01700, partial [Elusimicrobia bacterium]|nr:hypothetical protein [Elusimicrobiota bacterium]